LFAFGILTKRKINDKLALYVCLLAPVLIWGIDFINNIEWWQKQLKIDGPWVESVRSFSNSIFGGFKIGLELLIYNGMLTYIGLLLISRPQKIGDETQTISEYGNN
jgi:hypothetical protein